MLRMVDTATWGRSRPGDGLGARLVDGVAEVLRFLGEVGRPELDAELPVTRVAGCRQHDAMVPPHAVKPSLLNVLLESGNEIDTAGGKE